MALKYIKSMLPLLSGLSLGVAFANDVGEATLGLSSTLYSSLHSKLDPDYTLDSAWSISPGIKVSDQLGLLSSLNATKGLSGEREFEMTSFSIGGSYLVYNDEQTSLKIAANQIVPFSELEKDIQGLQMATSLSLPLAHTFYGSGFTLSYIPGARINFHEYQVAKDGKSNYRYTLSNSVNASYAFNDVVSLSGYVGYGRNFTYEGKSKDNFFHGQALNFQATQDFSLSFGHQLLANPLAPNGSRQNLNFIDNQKSLIFTNLMYQL